MTLTRDAPIEERAPEIVRRLSEAYPDAKVALNFTNPLECLVATILSAQSTDETVNGVTARLFQKYRAAEDYLRVPEDELKADIHSTGFFNQKATAIREACRRIVEADGGRTPRGVGRAAGEHDRGFRGGSRRWCRRRRVRRAYDGRRPCGRDARPRRFEDHRRLRVGVRDHIGGDPEAADRAPRRR